MQPHIIKPGFLSSLIILLLTYSLNAQVKHFTYRFSTGIKYDSNVFETSQNPALDQAIRISGNLTFRKYWKRVLVKIDFQSGGEKYFENIIEDRVINELDLILEYRIISKISGGIEARGWLKNYLNRKFDYHTDIFKIYYRFPLWIKTGLKLTFAYFTLNYLNPSSFDIREPFAEILFNIPVTKYLNTGIKYISGRSNYPLQNSLVLSDGGLVLKTDNIKRRDNFKKGIFYLTYTRKIFMNMEFNYRNLSSNSYGQTFRELAGLMLMTRKLGNKYYIKLFISSQIKKYSESYPDTIIIEMDPERNEQNIFLMELDRNISPNLIFKMGTGWYKNESKFRDRYYRKFLFTIGAEYKM
ncbi:MAG: hypothetical protein ACE5QV_01365 [Fidelibacterota bacterium]